MKRSSTVHSLLPNSDDPISPPMSGALKVSDDHNPSLPSASRNILEDNSSKKTAQVDELATNNLSPPKNIEKSQTTIIAEKEVKNLNIQHEPSRPPASKLARTKSIDHNDLKANKQSSNKLLIIFWILLLLLYSNTIHNSIVHVAKK